MIILTIWTFLILYLTRYECKCSLNRFPFCQQRLPDQHEDRERDRCVPVDEVRLLPGRDRSRPRELLPFPFFDWEPLQWKEYRRSDDRTPIRRKLSLDISQVGIAITRREHFSSVNSVLLAREPEDFFLLLLCPQFSFALAFYPRFWARHWQCLIFSRYRGVCIPLRQFARREDEKCPRAFRPVRRTNGAARTRSRHHNFDDFFHSLVAFRSWIRRGICGVQLFRHLWPGGLNQKDRSY